MLKKFLVENKTNLLVKDDLLNYIHSIYKKDHEVGGMLFISKLKDSSNYKLIDVSVPQPQDKKYKNSFVRTEVHIKFAKKIKRKTNGKVVYYGGWHSHHHSLLYSSKDIETWQEVAGLNYKKEYVFFLIIKEYDHRFYAIRTKDYKVFTLKETKW